MEPVKVLVVDDELGMRLGVKRVLDKFKINIGQDINDLGFSITIVESGEEALEQIAESKPDIMILDHKLPGIQGLDLLDELKQNKTDILTIMVTAYASIEVAISATKGGAFDFLAKPFTPAELKHTVSKGVKHLILKKRAEKLAEEKKQIRFQFISVLAHELKSPLAAVEGYLRIMDQRMAGDKLSGYEKMIKRSQVRLEGMRKMILDLLDLTRIESGKFNREIKKVDVIEILQDSIDSVIPDADQREIKVLLSRQEPLFMNADRGELEIIFNNFMSNGIKYNKDKGSLTIDVKEEKEHIVIGFIDTGIGMSEENVGRLFGEFVRIKSEETKNITGSGLGLSIVKKLIRFYDGAVEVKSTLGKGSVFSIKLKSLSKTENDA
jgi:signal transduction histidine kinase